MTKANFNVTDKKILPTHNQKEKVILMSLFYFYD
jgi:hypothetical protein